MAMIEVKVPDIGDFKDVAVIELLVKPGDTVEVEQSLLTVESDKASMEIPSSAAGVVKELRVAVGDKVNEGTVVLMLEARAAAAAPPPLHPRRPSAGCAGTGRRPPRLPPRRRGRAAHTGTVDHECDLLVLGRRSGRLFRRLPRRRPRPEGRARRALRRARRRLPERRLHPEQGAAARGRGDRRGEPLRRPRCHLRCAADRPRQAAARTRTRSSASSPAAWPRWPRCAR